MKQAVEREIITMCIKYSDLEVKELSELLYIINLSINDYYRDNGIASGQLSRYAPTIQEVQQGSIILDLLLDLLKDIAKDIANDVAVELIAGYLNNRIRSLQERYEKSKARRQIFDYEITTRLEIRIEKGRIIIEVKKRSLVG